MEWHYAENGQQNGPVSEDELLLLAQSGVIRPETLIWHSGMTDWKPFRDAGPGVPPPVPGESVPVKNCSSCARPFPLADLAIFGDAAICADCKPAWIQKLRQGMASTTIHKLNYAGFWIRFLATLIDGIVVGLVGMLAIFLFFGGSLLSIFQSAAGGGSINPFALSAFFSGAQLTGFALSISYYLFFWIRFGSTPGMMAVGTKIVRPDGSPIVPGQAVGRYFARILSGLILYIGYIMAGFDEEKRALHDRLAGTRVIRIRD